MYIIYKYWYCRLMMLIRLGMGKRHKNVEVTRNNI